MELLGPNLEELRVYCGGKFNLQTILMLADQMLARLEHIHDNFYIHRDLKPNNFAVGVGPRLNVLYLIDFGLGMTYKDRLTGTHIVFKDKKEIVGTIRFASVNAHYGMEQSRRDDLESLGYVLVYLIRGVLPWQKCSKGTQKHNEDAILQCKVSTTTEKLCTGLPCIALIFKAIAAFRAYFHKVKELKFEQRPDYQGLSVLFRDVFYRKEAAGETLFCWHKRYVRILCSLKCIEEGTDQKKRKPTRNC
eukprot:TRINITY_DN12697_c0_g1_i5.p1 TRINITY_DN12697_c0_g1~~TRINITY_DN12697_c0_g1_i5.p1  ORF type:complete len:248 (-),score=54.58 TRINITY_DN12697_c0_g1_i5:162-905(-)